ncbi:uncharacterized protein MONOS_6072 [Monocercomonoides exilis]|uniref:uncharacterized protein n=1 Tax=Monocercomonoides exilis TaxID=2049356 RepID=UPI00355A908E|nr:hypothetical protein MONOS_6072 [Monocercomonoides exilis]|eukprot:MONOS_6072.1-p1 / transcript=MONOS_6072.1 / gene=MONOS_6072 / organism=Monocercomonoides_exilis_PA203 / gene_product=unspecified product / transcript_product=unspecified product / location=Mono_scaffold00186:42297-44216(+) / protein_length=640 / sequence_SO=supercontig / SO=protein_coding / is_pseudo=false
MKEEENLLSRRLIRSKTKKQEQHVHEPRNFRDEKCSSKLTNEDLCNIIKTLTTPYNAARIIDHKTQNIPIRQISNHDDLTPSPHEQKPYGDFPIQNDKDEDEDIFDQHEKRVARSKKESAKKNYSTYDDEGVVCHKCHHVHHHIHSSKSRNRHNHFDGTLFKNKRISDNCEVMKESEKEDIYKTQRRQTRKDSELLLTPTHRDCRGEWAVRTITSKRKDYVGNEKFLTKENREDEKREELESYYQIKTEIEERGNVKDEYRNSEYADDSDNSDENEENEENEEEQEDVEEEVEDYKKEKKSKITNEIEKETQQKMLFSPSLTNSCTSPIPKSHPDSHFTSGETEHYTTHDSEKPKQSDNIQSSIMNRSPQKTYPFGSDYFQSKENQKEEGTQTEESNEAKPLEQSPQRTAISVQENGECLSPHLPMESSLQSHSPLANTRYKDISQGSCGSARKPASIGQIQVPLSLEDIMPLQCFSSLSIPVEHHLSRNASPKESHASTALNSASTYSGLSSHSSTLTPLSNSSPTLSSSLPSLGDDSLATTLPSLSTSHSTRKSTSRSYRSCYACSHNSSIGERSTQKRSDSRNSHSARSTPSTFSSRLNSLYDSTHSLQSRKQSLTNSTSMTTSSFSSLPSLSSIS